MVIRHMENKPHPKLTDNEPIIINDKQVYKNEWDRIRSMYFGGMKKPWDEEIDPLERLDRMESKRNVNQAR